MWSPYKKTNEFHGCYLSNFYDQEKHRYLVFDVKEKCDEYLKFFQQLGMHLEYKTCKYISPDDILNT